MENQLVLWSSLATGGEHRRKRKRSADTGRGKERGKGQRGGRRRTWRRWKQKKGTKSKKAVGKTADVHGGGGWPPWAAAAGLQRKGAVTPVTGTLPTSWDLKAEPAALPETGAFRSVRRSSPQADAPGAHARPMRYGHGGLSSRPLAHSVINRCRLLFITHSLIKIIVLISLLK